MTKACSVCVVDIDELAAERPCNPTSTLAVAKFLAPAAKVRVAAVRAVE